MNEDKARIIDFEQICRLCLREKKILLSIFKDSLKNSPVTISHKIMACASVNLHENDGLPNGICVLCLSSVNAAFEFRTQCENADKTLRDIRNILLENESKGKGSKHVIISDIRRKADVEIVEVNEDTGQRVVVQKVEIEQPATEELTIGSITPEKDLNCTFVEGKTIVYSKETSAPGSSINTDSNNENSKAANQRILVLDREQVIADPPKNKPHVRHGDSKRRRTRPKANPEKSTCPFCNKTLARLNDHIRLFHRNRVYVCTNQNCGAEFLTLKNLQSHQLRCYNVKKEYKCPECLKEFHRKSNWKAHTRRHSDKKEFQCQLCERAFVDSTGLRRHFLKHHEPEQEVFVSGCCGKKFKSKEGLKMHIRKGTCGVGIFKGEVTGTVEVVI